MGAQLDLALQVWLEPEGVGALGGGEGPTSMCGIYCFGFSAPLVRPRLVVSFFEFLTIRLVQKFCTGFIEDCLE
jgi:hypothetical protein